MSDLQPHVAQLLRDLRAYVHAMGEDDDDFEHRITDVLGDDVEYDSDDEEEVTFDMEFVNSFDMAPMYYDVCIYVYGDANFMYGESTPIVTIPVVTNATYWVSEQAHQTVDAIIDALAKSGAIKGACVVREPSSEE